MAILGKIIPVNESQPEEQFQATFSNGTVQQLKDLAKFLETKEFKIPPEGEGRLVEVLKVCIGWLQSIKDKSEEK